MRVTGEVARRLAKNLEGAFGLLSEAIEHDREAQHSNLDWDAKTSLRRLASAKRMEFHTRAFTGTSAAVEYASDHGGIHTWIGAVVERNPFAVQEIRGAECDLILDLPKRERCGLPACIALGGSLGVSYCLGLTAEGIRKYLTERLICGFQLLPSDIELSLIHI